MFFEKWQWKVFFVRVGLLVPSLWSGGVCCDSGIGMVGRPLLKILVVAMSTAASGALTLVHTSASGFLPVRPAPTPVAGAVP